MLHDSARAFPAYYDYAWKNIDAITTATASPTMATPTPGTLPDMALLESAGAPLLPSPDVAVGVVCALVTVSPPVVELDVAVAVEDEFIPIVLVEFL